MAKVTLEAIHRIAVGKPGKNGQLNYIDPGKTFAVEEADAADLVANGAAKKVEARTGEDAPKKVASGGSDDDAARLARLDEAKAMGVKGLRKDSSMEKIEAAIAEHEAANGGGDDDEDGDDDEKDLV